MIKNSLHFDKTPLEIISAYAQRMNDEMQSGEVGYYHLPELGLNLLPAISKLETKFSHIKNVIAVGIGGSSLGVKALKCMLKSVKKEGSRELYFLDNVDGFSFEELMGGLKFDESLFIISSKSGTTIETITLFKCILARFEPLNLSLNFLIITDPGSPLESYARENEIEFFNIPKNVGGRFSVLSAIGLVPLGLCGYDVGAILDGAKACKRRYLQAENQNEMLNLTTVVSNLAEFTDVKDANTSEANLGEFKKIDEIKSDKISVGETIEIANTYPSGSNLESNDANELNKNGLNLIAQEGQSKRAIGSLLRNNDDTLLQKAYHYATHKNAKINVIFSYSDRFVEFNDWYVQLWAESLGKKKGFKRYGLTPVGLIGSRDQHSFLQLIMDGVKDKTVTFIKILDQDTTIRAPDISLEGMEGCDFANGLSLNELINAQCDATTHALMQEGISVDEITLERLDERHAGYLIYYYELLTSATGIMLGINTYDQPGVEVGKRILKTMLKR